MQKKHNMLYYIALAGAVFFWSSAFIVSKAALVGMGPITLSTVRILICFFVLLPFSVKRGFTFRSLFRRNSFFYGVFGYGGNLILLTLGLTECSAGASAISHGLFPVFMLFFGYLLLSEKVTINKAVGIIFSIVGVVIASIGDLTLNTGSTLKGILLVVISVFSWAYYSVFAKKTAGNLDTLVLTELCFGTAAICTIPLAICEILWVGLPNPDHITIICILHLSLMSGVFATLLWNFSVKKVSTAVSGIYFNLLPVIGLAFAVAFGEQTSLLQITGCIFVLVGVLITTIGSVNDSMQ
ncbi:MAG: DMT family transporter [Eubacteriales bacterium]|nr:DMT family transporter [Eubacteriales bacterium]